MNSAANKLILLKTAFPSADVFSVIASRPKTLLQSEDRIASDAQQVGGIKQIVNMPAVIAVDAVGTVLDMCGSMRHGALVAACCVGIAQTGLGGRSSV